MVMCAGAHRLPSPDRVPQTTARNTLGQSSATHAGVDGERAVRASWFRKTQLRLNAPPQRLGDPTTARTDTSARRAELDGPGRPGHGARLHTTLTQHRWAMPIPLDNRLTERRGLSVPWARKARSQRDLPAPFHARLRARQHMIIGTNIPQAICHTSREDFKRIIEEICIKLDFTRLCTRFGLYVAMDTVWLTMLDSRCYNNRDHPAISQLRLCTCIQMA